MGNITKELQKLLKDYNKKVLQSVPTMARQIATDAEPEYRKIINSPHVTMSFPLNLGKSQIEYAKVVLFGDKGNKDEAVT